MLERVEFNGKLFALILRKEFEKEGANFFTSKESPLQFGVLGHKKGAEIKPHIHLNLPRTIDQVQEVLHMAHGRVQVDFYDAEGKALGSNTLNGGDTILLTDGGHGFKMLEDSKMIEIKQGPYIDGETDKRHF